MPVFSIAGLGSPLRLRRERKVRPRVDSRALARLDGDMHVHVRLPAADVVRALGIRSGVNSQTLAAPMHRDNEFSIFLSFVVSRLDRV